MIVKAMTAPEATSYLHRRFEGDEANPVGYEFGEGKRLSDDVYKEIRQQLVDLRNSFNEDDGRSSLEFDANGAEVLHRLLKIEDRIAASDEFWSYLACVELYEEVVWRHRRVADDGRGTLPPSLDHFGLGDKWGCLPKRLWFRAELSITNEQDDPYRLTRRGGMDFWTSGVLRKLYPSSRILTRALVRFQYPEDGEFVGKQYRPQTLTLGGIRELYKRIRHFNAFIAFPALLDAEADELLQDLAEGLPRQDA